VTQALGAVNTNDYSPRGLTEGAVNTTDDSPGIARGAVHTAVNSTEDSSPGLARGAVNTAVNTADDSSPKIARGAVNTPVNSAVNSTDSSPWAIVASAVLGADRKRRAAVAKGDSAGARSYRRWEGGPRG